MYRAVIFDVDGTLVECRLIRRNRHHQLAPGLEASAYQIDQRLRRNVIRADHGGSLWLDVVHHPRSRQIDCEHGGHCRFDLLHVGDVDSGG